MVHYRIIGHPLCAGYHRKLISGSLSSYPQILDYNVNNFECRAFKLISQNLKWNKIRFVTFVLGVSFINHLCSFMSSQIFPVIVLLLVLNPLTKVCLHVRFRSAFIRIFMWQSKQKRTDKSHDKIESVNGS